MSNTPIRNAHRITRQLDAARATADQVISEDRTIDPSTNLACHIIGLCADTAHLELYAATCEADESQTATLATTIAIRSIARMAHAIIRDTEPETAEPIGGILTPDTDIPQELTHACEAINPTSTTAYLDNEHREG